MQEEKKRLEEVVAGTPSVWRHMSLLVRHSREDAEFGVQVLVH